MMCPVCDGMYFPEPHKDSYGEVQCCHCGWIYDLNQVNNPDLEEGFNEMSLNEYKK